MIDPLNITKYDCTIEQLEEVLLFWVLAAGKNAISASKSLSKFLENNSPFDYIKTISLEELPIKMKQCGIGCFNNKAITFNQLAFSNIDLMNCSVEELEKIKGIGMKTSRCFVIHSRKNANYAGLDTHILKYLRSLGHDVPLSTPSGNKYVEIEKIFLSLVEKSGKTLSEFDLSIWKEFSGRK